MASKFEEEKRVLINDLTEEKSAHMHTFHLLEEEKQKSAMVPKLEQELSSLRTNFEDVQKMLIQAQKKHVEERNKSVVANQQIEELQSQVEQLQEANDKTQSLLEDNIQALEEHKTLLKANPELSEIQDLTVEVAALREKVAQLERDLSTSQEENARMNALLASSTTEKDKAVDEMKGLRSSVTTLQAQLDEAMFNLEMSGETIKDLNAQLSALGVSVTDSPSLSGSTASLLEQENARLSEEMNSLKANLVATETKLTRTTKQLNAFRLSASHDAKRNQATISSLQLRIAKNPNDPPSPSSTPEPPESPAKVRMNGVHTGESDGEEEDKNKELEERKRYVDGLIEQLRNKQEEIDALHSELTNLRAQKDEGQDASAQLEEAKTELENMRSTLERVEKELDERQAEAYALRAQSAAEMDALRVQLLQAEDGLNKLEQVKEELEGQLVGEKEKVVNGIETKQDEINALRGQLQRAQQEAHESVLRSASEEVNILRAQVDESKGEVEKLRAELSQAINNLETETNTNSQLTELLEQEKNKQQTDNELSHNKDAEIETLRAKLGDSEHELIAQAHRAQEKLEQLKHERDELERELDNAKGVQESALTKLNATRDELDAAHVRLTELQEKLEKSEFQNVQLEEQLAEKRLTNDEDEEVDALRSQLQQSHDDFEKASDANAELERQLEQAHNELEILRKAADNSEVIESLKTELELLTNVNADLEKQLRDDKIKTNAQAEEETEELHEQIRNIEKDLEKTRENFEKVSNANSALEKQVNQKQVELNTLRAQMLSLEREMELLRVDLLQAQDGVEKEKHTNLELARQLDEEMLNSSRASESHENDSKEELEALNSQLSEAVEALESEKRAKLEAQAEMDRLKKVCDEFDKKEKGNTDLERQLALIRAEETVLRAQLGAAKDEAEKYKYTIEDKEKEIERGEQEREQLASMIDDLQKANEELANEAHKQEGPKLNGKTEVKSPRKPAKFSSSESETTEVEEGELEEGELVVEDEEEEEEEIEDDEDDEEDEKEELVAELQEQIKDEQQRTTNLVQAIYTLQIELQQEKSKQGEMDVALTELQRGNERLTQEVYDLRNAWAESSLWKKDTDEEDLDSSNIKSANSSFYEEKERSPKKEPKQGNAEWDGLENEVAEAVGLRAVALRTILEDLENAKDKDIKLSNLRQQQFQLIDKLNDAEIELTENRTMMANLQREYDRLKMGLTEQKSAKELGSKLVQLEQLNASLTSQLEEFDEDHQVVIDALETKTTQLEQHNTTINERLKDALGLASEAEEEHVKDVIELKAKIEKLEEQNTTLTERLEASIALVAAEEEHQKTVEALQAKQAELEQNNHSLNKRLSAEMTAAANAELEHARAVEALESKLVQLEQHNADLAKENDVLERNAVSLAVHTNTTARELEESIHAMHAERADRENQVRLLLAERDANLAVHEELHEKMMKLERLADSAEVLDLRNAGLMRQIEELEAQLQDAARAKRETASLDTSLNHSTDHTERLEHQNAALASITDELRQRINELESNPDEIETLSQELAGLEEQRDDLTARNLRLEHECEKLRTRLAQVSLRPADDDSSEDYAKQVAELEKGIEKLSVDNERMRAKLAEQEDLHESFLVATEEERETLQEALEEEKEASVALEDTVSALKLENAKLKAANRRAEDEEEEGAFASKGKQLELEMELIQAQLNSNELREELAKAKAQCALLRSEADAYKSERLRELDTQKLSRTRATEEVARLKEELAEEKHKAKKLKKEKKELKEECKELKRDFANTPNKYNNTSNGNNNNNVEEKIKEECATLRGEVKVLREDRNIWRDECSKAKDEGKKWRDQCSEMELEFREVKIIHNEEVQLIKSLRRENELLRRDNEMLWEQLDSWGALDGLGKGGKDNNNNITNNNMNNNNNNNITNNETNNTLNNFINENISSILHPDSLNDSYKEERKEKKVRMEGDEEEDSKIEATAPGTQLTRSLLNSHDAEGADEDAIPAASPILRMQPHPHALADESFDSSGSQGIMYEAQALAHQRATAMILAQMDKLGGQLQSLVHNARSANNAQWINHQAQIAHAQSQLSTERGSTLRLRDALSKDAQRAHEASLDALRSHLDGIKTVYNALSN